MGIELKLRVLVYEGGEIIDHKNSVGAADVMLWLEREADER